MHADVGEDGLPRPAAHAGLQGPHAHRGDRRQQPLPRAGQPGLGARRPAAALAAAARAGHAHRRGRDGGHYRLTLDEAGSSTPNYCLLEKLRQVHGLVVPGAGRGRRRTAPAVDLEAALEAVAGRRWSATGCPTGSSRPPTSASCSSRSSGCGRTSTSTGRELAENPLVAHLVHQPTEPFARPGARHRRVRRPRRAGRAVPGAGRRLASCGRSPRPPPGAPSCWRGRPAPASRRSSPTCSTRAVADGKRVLFVAEKRAALDVVARRLDAVGMGPFALDLHDKGSQAGGGARADPRRAGARGRRRRDGLAADGEDAALGPPDAGPLRRPAARPERRRAVAVLGAGPRSWPRGSGGGAAAGAAAVRRAGDGGHRHRGAPGARAAAGDRRPDPPLAAARVGVRRHPARRPAGGAGGGAGRRRRRPRAADDGAAGRRAALGPHAGGPRRARPPASAGRRSASTSSTRRATGLWTAATSALQGEVAAFVSFRHPGPGRRLAGGARRCRWPSCTCARRPRRRRAGSAAGGG